MKKLLIATALALTIAAPVPASAGSILQGWREDRDFIHSHLNDPNPAVQHCAREMADDMQVNRNAITGSFLTVHVLLPAANHYRENTIMPWFENCVAEARNQG